MPVLDPFYTKFMASHAPFAERCPLSDMEKLVRRRDYREFCRRLRAMFSAIRAQNMQMFIGDDQAYFTSLFDLWFKVLEKPAFQLAEGDESLFATGGNFTNLLAVTPHRNADACIRKLIGQEGNMAKLLLLYSPRSEVEIPIQPLFEANPLLASLWYSVLWNWADTYVHPVVNQNYNYFLGQIDNRFDPFDSDLICGYFRCTYVDNNRDRVLKRVYNTAIRRYTDAAKIDNRPNPRSIAVVSAYWHEEHAVYRAFAPYVRELSRDYDITLVNLAPPDRKQPETSLFKRVCSIEASPAHINLAGIAENDFQLAYFPDVGMSQESVYLANLRVAPIQCMGTGHPVSSASPNMDYFISGGEVETADRPEENYDERLVLLPGLSVHPVKPAYVPAFPGLPADFIINCPWMHMKNNQRMAEAMRAIHGRAARPVVFSIYPGCGATANSSYMATMQDYANFLPPEAYVLHHDYPYSRYMESLERGRFTLHSHPFGGGTTAVDALILGKPLVVLQGRHEYNRYSAALLRRLGLEELIADTLDAWINISVRLVNEPEYLERMTRHVREADLDRDLFRVSDAQCLRRAFDELIRHDAQLRSDGSRKPIWIG